jgi:flagellar basal-body rod modification protein FlgD
MASAAAGIFSQHLAAGQTLTGQSASPMANAATGANSSDSSSDAGSGSSTISANDFLTLLVTEMQNQDPTANTDPNEYINQLVQVNSLEQLIDINQDVSTALGSGSSGGVAGAIPGTTPSAATPSTTSASPNASAVQAKVSAQRKGTAVTAAQNAGSALGTPGASAAAHRVSVSGTKQAPGNLSVPNAQPAAQTVAHALNGKSQSRSSAGRQHGAR